MERERHLINFHFLCPKDRKDQVAELLAEDGSVIFVLIGGRALRLFPGEDKIPEGLEVFGLCLKDENGRNWPLTVKLSKRGIAGYSRETQIFYFEDEDGIECV